MTNLPTKAEFGPEDRKATVEEKTPEETLKDNISSAKAFLEMLKNKNKK